MPPRHVQRALKNFPPGTTVREAISREVDGFGDQKIWEFRIVVEVKTRMSDELLKGVPAKTVSEICRVSMRRTLTQLATTA